MGNRVAGVTSTQAESVECQRVSTPMGQDDITVAYHLLVTRSLGRIYRGEADWPLSITLPLEVSGQPAVRTDPPWAGSCRLAIGLTDNQSVDIHVNNTGTDACIRAIQVGHTIIGNLGYSG